MPALDMRLQRLSEVLPFAAASFQTVVLNQVIEHLEPGTAKHVATEALRVLRPGGMLLVTAPSKANTAEAKADPTHINMMSPGELRALLLEQGFARTEPFDSPLPLLGRGRVQFGVVSALFKMVRLDALSATANVMAFKAT
jgi:SAM-dependent methyltransferase